jgi:hypothetical protein
MEPLIWTTKGNMPISALECKVEWFENDGEIGLAETYLHEGEVVRRSVHIRKKEGADIGAEQARIG